MKLLRTLIEGALRSYPREFRRRYAQDIRRDIEAEPEHLAQNLFKTWKDGLSMRLEDTGRDVAYAVSRLRRAPLFVAIVTITFELGIGANVAVFSAFNAIVLRPLPFPDAGRLVTIGKRVDNGVGPLTPLDISDLRAQLHDVSSISGVTEAQATMLIDGQPKAVRGANVGASYFQTLGTTPQIGRFFQASDARPGQHSVVISDSLWRTYFNGDLSAIGKRINLDGTSYAIVGVTGPGAQAPESSIGEATLAQPDYFTVIMPDASIQRRFVAAGSIGAIAALRPGVTVGQLNAELLVASQRVQALYPRTAENAAPMTFVAQSLADELIARIAPSLWMVLFVVFGILLVACANVSNVIGARWSAREREVAVRRALGASIRRIAVQLFIETGVLALLGGLAGLVVAYAALRFVPLGALGAVPRGGTISIDAVTLLYALLIVGITTVLAGFAPILALGRTELQLVLSSAGRGGDASRGRGLRSALVVAEVAIALAVVVSSGLLVRSFVALLNTPLGFNADGVYIAPFILSDVDNPKLWPYMRAQQQQLLARAAALPGADAVAISLTVPLNGAFGAFAPEVEGASGAAPRPQRATGNIVSPDYFRALGIPVLRGRAFAAGDSMAGSRVSVVSQTFVNLYLRSGEPVGQRIRACAICQWSTVVGVVPDVTQTLGEPPLATVYTPSAQHPPPLFSLVVHAPHSTFPAARREIESVFASLFPGKPAPDVYTVSDIIARRTQAQRFAATLLSVLALIPLILAISGIYGVVSFSVGQRSREFGVRMALGAKAGSILSDVLRRSLLTTTIGVALGIVLAALDARAIAPYLTAKPDFSAQFAGLRPQQIVSPFDPLTFAIVIAFIFACTAAAALVPALRATRVDPVVALRYE